MADRMVDIRLDDILVVVPQLTDKAKKFREFIEQEYIKNKGMNQEDCLATGRMWTGVPVDQRVMEMMKIIQIHHDGIAINPKWITIIKIAAQLRFGTREQRRAIKRKLDKLNSRTPFVDPSNLTEPPQRA